jgi:hypothetical protein
MRRFLCVLLSLVLSSGLVLAADGRIVGAVTDEGGGTLTGVMVTVHRRGLTRTAVTDAQGRFAISVPPGRYKLSAELSGFRTTKLKITVITGENLAPAVVMRARYFDAVTVEVRAAQP